MALRNFTSEVIGIMSENIDDNPGGLGDFFQNVGKAISGFFTGANEMQEDIEGLNKYLNYYMETENITKEELLALLTAVQDTEDRYKEKIQGHRVQLEDLRNNLRKYEITEAERTAQRVWRENLDYLNSWYGKPMQLDGNSPEERFLAETIAKLNSKISDPALKWGQEKIDELWAACELIYDEYGIQIDPRLALSVIAVEDTGSFNTNPDNLAGDGQNGVQADFAADLISANALFMGKVMGYSVYQEQFREAVQANNDGSHTYITGEGNIIQYMNWETPIVRLNGTVDAGVYAGNVYWADRVSKAFGQLGGDLEAYDSVVAQTDPSSIEKVTNTEITFPEFNFVCKEQAFDAQTTKPGSSYYVENPDKYSIIAERVN